MMRVEYFKENIEPHLEGYEFSYSTFPEVDFGKLDRVEFKGKNKVGAIDFWSQGWVGWISMTWSWMTRFLTCY
ncbi:hypothetical protein ABN140_13815 [Klebsiella michiganensis]|uniref:Uncharacterized protein n=1 Tax=Klebsiella pneumoniae TaxID=573 RepID=A0A486W1R8_KLEPN|nr:hypothetical protein [Klebsiella oxytoca]MCW9482125.1 hypothetical protein [Klebsiella oxytoca]VGM56801.1 Uncharacterised protein [Klebsiella pneumoniae]